MARRASSSPDRFLYEFELPRHVRLKKSSRYLLQFDLLFIRSRVVSIAKQAKKKGIRAQSQFYVTPGSEQVGVVFH